MRRVGAVLKHWDLAVLRRSLVVACVVGPTLLLVNQGWTAIWAGQVPVGKVLLTFAVPFLVSGLSSVFAKSHGAKEWVRHQDHLGQRIEPVVDKVSQIKANALLVNQTAKARFDETSALLQRARQTMQDLENGKVLGSQALEAVEDILSRFERVLAADAAVRDEIIANLEVAKSVGDSIASANDKFKAIADLAHEIGRIGHQTTLLSLNAAVVAATAGPEGRRFAVIAESVRHLARETEAQASAINGTTRELQASAAVMAKDARRLSDGMGRLLVSSDNSGQVVQEARQALANSGALSKQSLQLQANQTDAIAGITSGIERIVDHAGGAIEGSARNAALAGSVLENLDELAPAATR